MNGLWNEIGPCSFYFHFRNGKIQLKLHHFAQERNTKRGFWNQLCVCCVFGIFTLPCLMKNGFPVWQHSRKSCHIPGNSSFCFGTSEVYWRNSWIFNFSFGLFFFKGGLNQGCLLSDVVHPHSTLKSNMVSLWNDLAFFKLTAQAALKIFWFWVHLFLVVSGRSAWICIGTAKLATPTLANISFLIWSGGCFMHFSIPHVNWNWCRVHGGETGHFLIAVISAASASQQQSCIVNLIQWGNGKEEQACGSPCARYLLEWSHSWSVHSLGLPWSP